MAGKAQSRKGFGKKLKDQQDDNKTLYSLANQGTIMQSNASVISGGSQGGGSWLTTAMSDINMNTYDIRDVDRIFFATKIGAGDPLLNTDYGIEAAYLGGDAYGILHRVPSGKQHIFMRGDDIIFSINSDEVVFNDDISVAGYEDMYKMTEPDSPPASWRRIFVDEDNSDNLSVKKSDGTVVDLEASGWVGTATSDLDMDTYDIVDVCRIEFDQGGDTIDDAVAGIDSSSDKIRFNVPSGDHFSFTVDGDDEVKIDGTDFGIWGYLKFNSHTSGTDQPATTADGYINIKIGASDRKLYFYV